MKPSTYSYFGTSALKIQKKNPSYPTTHLYDKLDNTEIIEK